MHDMQRDDRQLSLNESSSRYVTIYTYTQTNPARYPTGPQFGPVSPSEQPDWPGFRANFSHWRPVGSYLKPNPIRAVLKLPKTRPIYVRAGLTSSGPITCAVLCQYCTRSRLQLQERACHLHLTILISICTRH